MTPKNIQQFSPHKILGINYSFSSTVKIIQNEPLLKNEFECCVSIPGIRDYYRYVPASNKQIMCYVTWKCPTFHDLRTSVEFIKAHSLTQMTA